MSILYGDASLFHGKKIFRTLTQNTSPSGDGQQFSTPKSKFLTFSLLVHTAAHTHLYAKYKTYVKKNNIYNVCNNR